MGETPTMSDVARAANVSIATVSRALAGDARVRPATLEVVLQAAAELGYRGNSIARALRQGRTHTLGIVVPNITNPFFPELLQALERSARDAEFGVLFADSSEDIELEHRCLQDLIDRRVDGIIVVPCATSDSASGIEFAAQVVPLVQVDRHVPGMPVSFVGVDNVAAIRDAVNHLRQQGRRHIAYAGASQDRSSTAAERLDGFLESVPDTSVGKAPIYLGDYSISFGVTAGESILHLDPVPDAVVCGNDQIAIGVIRALKTAGLKVPADIAVTGFDNSSVASLHEPAVTTLIHPLGTIATTAISLLVDDSTNPTQRHVRFPAELAIRASTVP